MSRAVGGPAAGRAAAALACLVLAGCSLVGGGSGQAPGSPAPGQPADASGAAAGTSDTTTSGAAADSGTSLRDSILAVLDSARAEQDTAAEEEDAGPADREPNVAESGPSGPILVTSVDSLKALGPVYTPYDVGPVLRKEGLEGLLRATILPVIRKHDLPPDEWARFWVLVDREGRVVDTVDHLTSGHGAFDDAARVVAESLRYRPAVRDEEFVPVWILARISLLMA